MTEITILDATLDLIDDTGTNKAYEYLVSHLNEQDARSRQAYNFLYCLAASSGKPEEAIIDKGSWYSPELFEGEDLGTVRNNEKFTSCEAVSSQRYEEALTIINARRSLP